MIELGYSRPKAFEALHVPRYCCRAHLENPDLITVSLTTREVSAVEKEFIKELGAEEGGYAAVELINEMFDIDPYNMEDPTSLINDIHTTKMVSSVLAGTFGKRVKKEPVINVSNEEIARAKRENKSIQIHEDELVAFDEDGNIVRRRPLPIIIRPTRPETRKQQIESVKRVESIKGSSRRVVQTTPKSSIFATGYRPKRVSAVPAKKEGEEFDVGYKSAKRSAIRKAQEGEEGEDIYEIRGSKAIEVEEGKAELPTYRVKVEELREGEVAPKGYTEAYVTKPRPFRDIPQSEARLVGKRK